MRLLAAWAVSVGWGTLAVAAQTPSCGANASSTISTDRPQVTNSSVAVPCGSLQFENGLQESGDGRQRSLDLPETSVRLGVANKTELQFMVPDYFSNEDTGTAFAGGFGDSSVGFKQQLGPVRGFDVSLIGSLSLPTGAAAISSHGYDPAVQLPWSRSVSKNWTAAGQLAVAWPTETGGRSATGQASLYFDRQLTPPWDAYAEYSGAFPSRGGPQHTLDFGSAYKLSPHRQVDFHVGFGLSTAAASYTVGFGYSVRFQVFGRSPGKK